MRRCRMERFSHAQKNKTQPGKNRWRNRRSRRYRVGTDESMIPPHTATVHFSGLLRGQQIIGHGDGGQQDEDCHRQRCDLREPPRAPARSMPQPQDNHARSQQHPREIERQFHCQGRFYISKDARRSTFRVDLRCVRASRCRWHNSNHFINKPARVHAYGHLRFFPCHCLLP